MELINVFLLCAMSGLIGAVSMLLIQYVVYVKFFNTTAPADTFPNRGNVEQFAIPESLMCNIQSADPVTKNSMTAFNLIFQFLFFELRYATKVRNWFYRKVTHELEELIEKTSLSKFFDKLMVRDIDFGSEFPEIKNLRVHNVDLHETEGHIETLDLVMDLQYNGHFKLTIDCDMLLGRRVFLSVKVKHLSGLCRLQFTRKPYSHWSICFIGDPKIDMDIETKFHGRHLQLQPQLNGLVSNQIRKTIRRKHTLPVYKIRYKPFFTKAAPEYEVTDIEPSGKLDVTICELTRLQLPAQTNHVFCTVTLSPIPWINARQHNQTQLVISLEVTIHRAKNQQIGIMFKQLEASVIIESILPNTPATMANILPGDALMYIENKPVSNIGQITKIIKGITKKEVTLRLERMVEGSIWNDNGCDEAFEEYEDMDDFSNIKFSKDSDSVHIGTRTQRKFSQEKLVPSSDSSISNTPSNSPKKTESTKNIRADSISSCQSFVSIDSSVVAPSPSVTSTESAVEKEDIVKDVILNDEVMSTPILRESIINEKLQQHMTIDALAGLVIKLNDMSRFELSANAQWLNVCVFGRCNDDVELLGYANVPVANMLMDCEESSLWHLTRKFSLYPGKPPDLSKHQLSSLSGFEPKLCYGDILMSFAWTHRIPEKEVKKPKTKETACGPISNPTAHQFVRTHFNRSTICDYCGKKIWLKEAMQCQDCNMCCHKKCIKKCQLSTVCASCVVPTNESSSPTVPSVPVATTALNQKPAVELTFTKSEKSTEDNETTPAVDQQQRSSFTAMIAQNIKRVNSANNLSIPGMGSSPSHSRSLPPSPQQSPRKQSLVNQSTNPFVVVVQKLEQLSDVAEDIIEEQIRSLTEPLIGWGRMDELMGLAKTASRSLYGDQEPNDRVDKINVLLARIRIALDIETSFNSTSQSSPEHRSQEAIAENGLSTPTDSLHPTRKLSVPSAPDTARRAFLAGQSEERVQALSVVMLYLCTGLQHAQGVATN